MAKFHFRLATLLKLRHAARDARRSELGQAYEAAMALARQKAVLDGQLLALKEQVRHAAGPGNIDLERMIQAQRYQAVLSTEQRALGDQATMLAHEIERRRVAMVAADRDVRVLEKLRERQEKRHRQKELKEEIKELDQLAARGMPQLQ